MFENWGVRKDENHRANKWQFSINNQGVNLNDVFGALSVFFPSGLRLEMQIDNPTFFIAQLSCAMKMDFSDAHLTIVVVPIDLRVGYLRLATIAECLLGIPVTKGGHFVAFIGKHRQICKVIWCDNKGSYLLTRKLNTGRFEQLLVKVKANNSSVQLTAAEFESFLDGEPVFERPQGLKF